MAPLPGGTTLYKITQTLPNGTTICKVFTVEGQANAFADLLVGVEGAAKTVQVATLVAPNISAMDMAEFFKTGGMLFSTADIK